MDIKASKPTFFLATADPESARAFYEDALGLTLESDEDFALVYQLSGAELRISKVPSHKPHPFSVLDWQVSDIQSAHANLAAKGISFSIYDGMGQDDKGIWTSPDGGAQILWFNDPDGNVLSVSQRG